MNRINYCYLACLFILFSVLCASCSTRKNTFANRSYHTVTSKFNVNFNAKEALAEGERELEKKSMDNFTTLLPIYNYPPKKDLASIYPTMDRAIEKCSKSIYKHSMMIRGKEYVKTMDDAYLIMGKAYFYKQDYSQAQRIFNFITSTYKDGKWNACEEAMIWNVRTAIRQGYFSTARVGLDEVAYLLYKSKNKKLKVLYNAAGAEYHLTAPDGDPLAAIDYINDALANKPKRDFKTRLYFIQGQLYEMNDQLKDAQKSFQQVLKSATEYEMVFSAHMHLAMNYDGTPSSRESIMRGLEKMLEESKNDDFRDQIYYAMSKIAEKDEDLALRKDFLAQSVAAYTKNDYQRTFSSLLLADLLFNEDDYRQAQAYYDTALMTLPENYPQREGVVKKGNVLRGLVDNLNVISLQDSLQRIAKMSEAERGQWVRRMIDEYTAEERRQAEEEANRIAALGATAGMYNINTTTSNGKWYFYNQSLITQGKTEFFRLWGNRKLEDNWRISNKQQLSFDEMAVMNDPSAVADTSEYDEEGNLIKQRETDPKKAEFYTQDLPLTPEAIDSSNKMIVKAIYNTGIIYLDDLGDIKRSNDAFRDVVSRFPEDELALPSLFLLYHNLLRENDPEYNTPKNTILTKYPESDYAKLIQNPNYYRDLAEQEKRHERKYEETFEAYTQKDWNRTLALAETEIPQVVDLELRSKFEYLKAVAVGQTQGEDSLKASLSRLLKNYPESEVAELVKIYLSLFSEADTTTGTSTSAGDKKTGAAATPGFFNFNPAEMHYVVLIVDINKYKVDDVKKDISIFNEQFFNLQRFNINSFYINQNDQMISISRFRNAETAMEYYHVMEQNDLFKSSLSRSGMTVYAISASNYTTFYNNVPSRTSYGNFFEENYLQTK